MVLSVVINKYISNSVIDKSCKLGGNATSVRHLNVMTSRCLLQVPVVEQAVATAERHVRRPDAATQPVSICYICLISVTVLDSGMVGKRQDNSQLS